MRETPRTSFPISPELRDLADRRVAEEGLPSLAALCNRALDAYLRSPPQPGRPPEPRPTGPAIDGLNPDLVGLTAAVRDLIGELQRALPAMVEASLGFRQLQDQIDDITAAVGRRLAQDLPPPGDRSTRN